MRRLILASSCLALMMSSFVSAQDVIPAIPLQPMPAPIGSEFGVPVEGPVVHYDEAPAPLFTRVKYVDKREMHPCAVPKIIRVNDPCDCKRCDSCCGDKCVYIQICVPPCGCENVKCRRNGDRVRYDYGKYKVDVRVRKGFIVVDYQK